MLWNFIINTYKPGEPIIASDIDLGMSEVNRRQQFKVLTDSGKLKRFENGIYYIPKKSRLGGEVSMPPDIVVERKYVSRNNQTMGYYSGYTFANQIGVSTQMPYELEIVTNEMGTPIKRLDFAKRTFVLRKARTQITDKNVKALQFLDLLKDIDIYSELSDEETKECLTRYIVNNGISKEMVDTYLPLFPDKIYKAIYIMEVRNVFA